MKSDRPINFFPGISREPEKTVPPENFSHPVSVPKSVRCCPEFRISSVISATERLIADDFVLKDRKSPGAACRETAR